MGQMTEIDTGVDGALRPPAHAVPTGLRRGRTWILALGDLVALTVAYVAAYIVADEIAPLPPVQADAWFLILVAVTAPFVWLGIFTSYHLYENDNLRISVSSFDEVRDLFHAILAGSLGYLILSQGVRVLFDWWVSAPAEAVLFLAAGLITVPIMRGSIRSWIFPKIMKPKRTLIVGSGEEALLVFRKIKTHPEYGLEIVGFLDGDSEQPLPAPVLGSPDDVAHVVDEFEIDRVLLASSVGSHEETLDLVRTVRRPDVQVSIVPRYFEIFTSHAILDDVEGMPVVTLPPMRLGRSARLLKRSFDMVVSGTSLLLLSPLLGAIAVAIRLDSTGPDLYRQPRRGRLGSTFEIVKFRTMFTGAEQKRAEVLHMNEVDGPLFKIKGKDPQFRMELAVDPYYKIEFEDVDSFITQHKFTFKIAAAIDHLIPDIPRAKWRQIQQLLLHSTIEIVNPELSWEGQTRISIHNYLSTVGIIPNIESQLISDQYKPVVFEGCIAIHPEDWHSYLAMQKTAARIRTPRQLSSDLSAFDAVPVRIRSSKHRDQSRWALPLNEFDPKDYKQWPERSDRTHRS